MIFYIIILTAESTTELEWKTWFTLSHYFIFVFHWVFKPKPFIYPALVKLHKERTTDLGYFCVFNNTK